MSKKKSLLRLDAVVERSAQYPDINEFLKDSQYDYQSSNYMDNQSTARLTLLLDRALQVQVDTIVVAGFVQQFYLTSAGFYGYNPDVEALGRVVLTLPTFPGFSKEFSRDGLDYRFNTFTGDLAGLNDTLTNYRLSVSNRGVAQILTHVFDQSAELAFDQFGVAADETVTYTPEALLEYVQTNLYSVSIPVLFTYYYYNSDNPAFAISASFSLKDILNYLREDFAPSDVGFLIPGDETRFVLSVRAQRPVLLTLTVSVSGKQAQQQLVINPEPEIQKLTVNAGYALLYQDLITATKIGDFPQILVSYTYRPLGYSADVVDPVYVLPVLAATTAFPIIGESWFFGNYPTIFDVPAEEGWLQFSVTFSSKAQLNVQHALVRVDPGLDNPIDKVMPVTGQGVSDAAYRNEAAELTVSLTPVISGSYAHDRAFVTTLSNTNRVIRNTRYSTQTGPNGLSISAARLVTNVNQVSNEYDTLERLAPVEAVTTQASLTEIGFLKGIYTYRLMVKWPNYPQGSVLWPFLTTTRVQVALLDAVLRKVAQFSAQKPPTEIYSPAAIITNPLRVSYAAEYADASTKRWFPKYPSVFVNGSNKVTPKKLSFSYPSLLASLPSGVLSADYAAAQEVPIKLSKQTVQLSNQLITTEGLLFQASTSFFTTLFFKKFVPSYEHYGYLLDQSLVAVSKKVGKSVVFYSQRTSPPYLAAFDPGGFTSTRVGYPKTQVNRFVSKDVFSALVRRLTGDSASKKITATIYLVTGLHPVLDAKKQVLHYEIKYDADYKIIPGLIFSITGAWV